MPQLDAPFARRADLDGGFVALSVEDDGALARLHPQDIEAVMRLAVIEREAVEIPRGGGDVKSR